MLFFTFLTGLVPQVSCSIILQYPPLVIGELGSSVNLSCRIGDITGYCFSVMWFKLGLGETPKLNPINAYMLGSNVLSAGVDEECNLTITIQHSDTGTYFCAYVRSSAIYVGNGSTIFMKSNTLAAPNVVVIPPDEDVPLDAGTVTLVCLVFGAHPDQLHISWLVSGSKQEKMPGVSSSNWASDVIRNDISIEERVWRDGAECTCVVETTEGQKLQRTVKKKCRLDVTLTLLRSFEILLFLLSVTVILLILRCLSRKAQRTTQAF